MKTSSHAGNFSRREWARLGLAAALSGVVSGQSHNAAGAASRPKPNDVLRELADGNARFVGDHLRHPHDSRGWARKTFDEGQHPHAVVLCCSDSRVSPELVFDQGIGDVFVVRVAGNVANEDEIASIEYATQHLQVPLVVVLGHSQCGAVSAVVNGEELPTEIQHLVVHIEQALGKVHAQSPALNGAPLIEATVRANVQESIQDMLSGGATLAKQVHSGEVRIEGAVYDLKSGRVTWLNQHG